MLKKNFEVLSMRLMNRAVGEVNPAGATP